jgi:hypothetical protein
MHPSELTGKLLDYYETHVQPNLGSKTQFRRTMTNLVGGLQDSFKYLVPVRHYLTCLHAGESIVNCFRAETSPTEQQIETFKAQLRQTDMAAQTMPKWLSV